MEKEAGVEESIETILTKGKLAGNITLYHGSSQEFDIIQPMTNNAGTKLSHARKSSFFTTDKDMALFFAFNTALNEYFKQKNCIDHAVAIHVNGRR